MSTPKTYKVSHILVPHQYEAEDLLKRLQKGEAFEELARKHSSCPSASNGGDLGTLRLGQAVEDFEEAALVLSPGETSSKPVRTRFGYHILKRNGP